MFPPLSPSLNRLSRAHTLTFESYDDIEDLLACAVVGNRKYKDALLKYRACSKRLLAAVTARICEWCADLARMQAQWVSESSDPGSAETCASAVFRIEVLMERKLKAAFDTVSFPHETLFKLNRFDAHTYIAILTQTCTLCRGKIARAAHVEDREEGSHTPLYTHAHATCQRKHMITLSNGQQPLPRSLEPRDLHRDAVAVASLRPNGKAVDRSTVLPLLSKWYRVVAQPRYSLPIHVWLHPHPRVHDEATVFGALGVTTEQVRDAVHSHSMQVAQATKAADQRRQQLQKRAQELADAYCAELCLWLGKGKTRWRNMDELASMHENVMHSLQVSRITEPNTKRIASPRGLYTLCNCIYLFGRTLDMMTTHTMSRSLLEWAVNDIKLNRLFEASANELLYMEDASIDAVVDNEARVYARILSLLEDMRPESLRRVRTQPAYDSSVPGNPGYSFRTSVLIEGNRYKSSFTLSTSEIVKLKYTTEMDVLPELAKSLPPAPTRVVLFDTDEMSAIVSRFVHEVLRVCLSRGSGMARARALQLLVPQSVVDDIRQNVMLSMGVPDGRDTLFASDDENEG